MPLRGGEEGAVGLDVVVLERVMNEMRSLREDVCAEQDGDKQPADHVRAKDNTDAPRAKVVKRGHRG
jgi:hypothetical protein